MAPHSSLEGPKAYLFVPKVDLKGPNVLNKKFVVQFLEKSGEVGDIVTNLAFLSLVMLAKTMPGQITGFIRTFKLMDGEAIDKVEELIEKIVKIIETGRPDNTLALLIN